jgi:hypothetical protein
MLAGEAAPRPERRLSDQPFAQGEAILELPAVLRAVAGDELERRTVLVLVGDVEHPVLRVHQRGELAHDQVGDGGQVSLALEHAAEAGEVGLEPVLFRVLQRLIL